MNRSDKTIVVTGATGRQGGAAARHLLGDDWHVKALVRDLEKPAARALANSGAELVLGDLRDRASIDAAVAGAYGVYSMQVPSSVELEIAESTNLADAALAAGVEHFVYSSVIGADRDSDLQWVAGKVANERYLRSLELPVTIFRPATFMENLLGQKDTILGGKMTRPEPPDQPHQWIAVDDIGRFIALAFLQPQTWIGAATEIAGDELTGDQAATALSVGLGVPVVYEQQAARPGAPAAPPAEGPPPNRADIGRLREYVPELKLMIDWAAETRAAGLW